MRKTITAVVLAMGMLLTMLAGTALAWPHQFDAASHCRPSNNHAIVVATFTNTASEETERVEFLGQQFNVSPGESVSAKDDIGGAPKPAGTVTVTSLDDQGTDTADYPAVPGCKPPVEHKVFKPKAHVEGPCGDPMYRPVYDNRKSDGPVTFRFRFHKYGSGMVTITKRVGTRLAKGAYVHVLGGSTMTIKARGDVLFKGRSAPAGNYPACQ